MRLKFEIRPTLRLHIHISSSGFSRKKNYTILEVHVPLSRILKNNFVRCPYKDFFGHRFRKKNNSIFGPLTIIPQKTVDQSSGATFEYLSGKKKFVQIGRLLFEIWAKTCRKILNKMQKSRRSVL